MRNLFIIRGLPGSGKSTLAENLLEEANSQGRKAIILEADQFFVSSNGYKEIYNFDRKYLGAAHDECYGRAMRYLRDGYTVLVANTFTTAREINRYVDGYKRCGLGDNSGIYIVKCTGKFRSIHGIPARSIEKMRQRWEDYKGEHEYYVATN